MIDRAEPQFEDTKRVVYMFTSGEYSDYGVSEHIEGPAGVDIQPHLDRAVAETDAAYKAWQIRREAEAPWNWRAYTHDDPQWKARQEWEKQNPPPKGTLALLMDFLTPLGFRELDVIEVHEYAVEKEYA